MTIKALVMSERSDEYTGKRGLVKQQLVNVVDMEDSKHRLVQPMEYSLSDQEKEKYAGKLQGKTVMLAVHEILPFGGRLRCRGEIVSVDGVK